MSIVAIEGTQSRSLRGGEEGISPLHLPFYPLFAKWAWDIVNHDSSPSFAMLGTWRRMERIAIWELAGSEYQEHCESKAQLCVQLGG